MDKIVEEAHHASSPFETWTTSLESAIKKWTCCAAAAAAAAAAAPAASAATCNCTEVPSLSFKSVYPLVTILYVTSL